MSAVTLLGCDDKGREFDPGMEGAHADIVDFKEDKSLFAHYVNDPKIIETIINGIVDGISEKFNAKRKEDEKKVDKLNELLKKYNKKLEDITFDYKDMKDDELEAKFAEVFAAKSAEEPKATEVPASDPKPVDTKVTFSIKDGDNDIALFSLNAEDTRVKLMRLARKKFGDYVYAKDIYPETHELVLEAYTDEGYKTYRMNYSVDENSNYSLGEDAVEVHAVYLTDEEDKAVDSMKTNFSKLQDEVNQYKKKEDDVKKTALLSAKKYSYIANSEEMKSILSEDNKAEFDKMTSEELETKLNNILIKNADEGNLTFAKSQEKTKKDDDQSGIKLFPFAKPMENSRYGGLFNTK